MNAGRSVSSTTARALLVALLTLCLLLAGTPMSTPAHAAPSALSEAYARAASDLAAGYMTRSVAADGRFAYAIDMDPSVQVSPSYNILRHAGSVWAMCEHYQSRPTPAEDAAIARAAGYLRSRRVSPLPGRGDLLAVWSYPEDDGDVPTAKLGGTGLGLAALTSVERIRPGSTPMSTLQSLGRFLLFMQRPDGSFYTQYVPSRGGRTSDPPSLFYPGEAALGLLMLYEVDPNPVWLSSANKALTYLAESRLDENDPPGDHWALIATQKLMQLAPDAGGRVEVREQLLLNHMLQVCEPILDRQVTEDGDPRYVGAFSSTGGTTSTSTSLEGLQAALATLPEGHPSRARIQEAVDNGMAFLFRAQVVEGRYAGAFPSSLGATDVRIDFVQHALSAMLRYAGDRARISRLAGATRYDTAVAVSRSGWPSSAGCVVVATGADFPDALCAAPLAKAYGGPVLLTPASALPAAVTAELRRLAPKQVFVIGGGSAVSPSVASQLAALPSRPSVSRLGASDRYGTASRVAAQLQSKLGPRTTAVVTTGGNFPDALSAAPLAAAKGWPILLTTPGKLPAATARALSSLRTRNTLVVGGVKVVSNAVTVKLPSPTRKGGADRYATCAAIADYSGTAGLTFGYVGLATGENFPDALAVGPLVGARSGVLLLTPKARLPIVVSQRLSAHKTAIGDVNVVGGMTVVPPGIVYQVGAALQ